MNLAPIVAAILDGYPLDPWGFHGVVHWARVLQNGLRLSETTGANTRVVSLFAIFHDSRRKNDSVDHGHGQRGADLAADLRGQLFDLPDSEFELLCRACALHTNGRTDPNITVLTCWDADRLDLGRVGIVPNPKYLCTPDAKQPAIIEWAHGRACRDYEPEIVSDWNVLSQNR